MDRRTLITLGAGAALASASGCMPRRDHLRFRFVLRLVVGSDVIEASSVREDLPGFPSDGAPNFGWRGEATIADVGSSRIIAAMLDGYTTLNGYRQRSNAPWSPASVLMERKIQSMPRLPRGQVDWTGIRRPAFAELRAELKRAPLRLSPDELPVLVAFPTPSVPGSGMVVEPSAIPALFPDVRLGRCSVELTSRPVQFGKATAALPWIDDGPGRATSYTHPIKSTLVVNGDFQRR